MRDGVVTVTTLVGDAPLVTPGHPMVEAEAEVLRKGDTIARYVIDAHVGAGGIGRIYAAHDPKLDRRVALKLLRAERDDELGRTRLIREARALAKLAHPHVVAVHDVGLAGEQVFVAMEYVSGTTLTQRLAQRRHRWRELLELLIPVAQGLAAVHAAGMVHRDLKPDNIMIGDDGRVRVVDFGLARSAFADEPKPEADAPFDSPTTRSRTGLRLGTPAYMAPEQWRGLAADARTDQFAYCVTLWEALYGERPFAGQTPAAFEHGITSGILSTPRSAVDVPSWLHRTLVRGLSIEPGDRYPSMNALIDVLAKGRRRVRDRSIGLAVGLAVVATVSVVVGSLVDREEPAAQTFPNALAHCAANEVCARGPRSVPACTLADGEAASEGKPCTPGSDDECPERESCVTLVRPEGEFGQCTPVCTPSDDRPECVVGCYNQQCAGNFDLCVRGYGTCRPVPCSANDDCTIATACDFPLQGSPDFRCNLDIGFCERERESSRL